MIGFCFILLRYQPKNIAISEYCPLSAESSDHTTKGAKQSNGLFSGSICLPPFASTSITALKWLASLRPSCRLPEPTCGRRRLLNRWIRRSVKLHRVNAAPLSNLWLCPSAPYLSFRAILRFSSTICGHSLVGVSPWKIWSLVWNKKAASLSLGLNIIYFFTFGPRECGGRNTRLFAPFQHPQTFFYSFFFLFSVFFYIVITFVSPLWRFRRNNMRKSSCCELRRCLTRSACYSHTIWWHLSVSGDLPTAEKCNKHVTDQAVTPSQLANQQHRLSLRALENSTQTLWLWISCSSAQQTPRVLKNKYQHFYARPDISAALL